VINDDDVDDNNNDNILLPIVEAKRIIVTIAHVVKTIVRTSNHIICVCVVVVRVGHSNTDTTKLNLSLSPIDNTM
jgi:hypothetical protein